MPKVKSQSLTDLFIKKLKPKERPYKVFDGKGLFLLVTPQGSKLWRFKYTYNGKENVIAIGSYPEIEISLSEAREKALLFRKHLQNGLDPSLIRKEEKLKVMNNFGEIALEFVRKFSPQWSQSYLESVNIRLKKHVLPALGNFPIDKITTPMLIRLFSSLLDQGKGSTVEKLRILIGQVFRYAIATGRITFDPTSALKGALPPHRKRHYPAQTEPEKLASVLKTIWDYPHSFIIRNALRVLVYTFQRPGEVVSMKWDDINWERKEWRFVLSKRCIDHIVPLSRQVLEILNIQRTIFTNSSYVFPGLVSPQTRHITVEALDNALKRMRINTKEEQTCHGFRTSARTILHEVLGFEPDVIEHQLGHKVPDRLGEAYNRTKFLEKRKEMMQAWADFIDSLLRT